MTNSRDSLALWSTAAIAARVRVKRPASVELASVGEVLFAFSAATQRIRYDRNLFFGVGPADDNAMQLLAVAAR